MDRKKIANRVSYVSISVNVVLSAVKLIAGIFAHSGAMISDSIHSLSDVISTVGVIIGIGISERKSDKSHHYGHERFECIFSILLAVMLAITGIGIGYSGIKGIINRDFVTPGMLALAAAAFSIVVKELMYRYTMHAAKKINSTALKADAWHHRSDMFSSVGALIGIGGAIMGFPILDPIASVIICLFIIKAAFDIFMEATNQLVDRSCGDEEENKIREHILKCSGVLGVDLLNTRLFGSKMYVDVEISADGNLPLKEAHEIAENVHHSIEKSFPLVKHCMVHVNPYEKN